MRRRVIDPALLPHERPCWCVECKRVYGRLHRDHERKLGVVRKRLKKCVDCEAKCSEGSQRCRFCAFRSTQSIRSVEIKKCVCGAPMGNTSKSCRDCYLASATKIFRHNCVCQQCGKSWRSQNADSVFCSSMCRRASHGLGPTPKRQSVAPRGTCRTCSGPCKNFVCEQCKRNVRKIHKRMEKNLRRGASTASKYDKRKIAIRDAWTCYLCGGSVPPHLWGHHAHPDAPTIDHVFPVSLGGPDVESNVRLAHRLCNMKKSNKVGERVGSRTKRKSGSSNAEAA